MRYTFAGISATGYIPEKGRQVCFMPGGGGRYFKSVLAEGATVLDFGAGPGLDMIILKVKGFDIYGINASPEMVKQALVGLQDLKERLICGEISSDELFFNMKFDSVLCSAMLMHISDDRLFDCAYCIKNCLKENGRLLVSISVERDDLDREGRTADGRLFVLRTADYYTLLFERLGFKKIEYYEEGDSLGRAGVKWGVIVYQLDYVSGSRSLDNIQS